jgi:hypothetical protein
LPSDSLISKISFSKTIKRNAYPFNSNLRNDFEREGKKMGEMYLERVNRGIFSI